VGSILQVAISAAFCAEVFAACLTALHAQCSALATALPAQKLFVGLHLQQQSGQAWEF
jgi:hypothetical protein